jgi:hypothetical protein
VQPHFGGSHPALKRWKSGYGQSFPLLHHLVVSMDPLSITASVIAVVGAAQESGKVSLKFLRNLKNAPRELQELIDEVTQIGTVLDDVKSAVEAGGKSTPALDLLLKKAAAKLLELEKLIHYELIKAKEDVRVDRVAWATHQKQVVRFQEQLRNIRHDITTVLSARTLYVGSTYHSIPNFL